MKTSISIDPLKTEETRAVLREMKSRREEEGCLTLAMAIEGLEPEIVELLRNRYKQKEIVAAIAQHLGIPANTVQSLVTRRRIPERYSKEFYFGPGQSRERVFRRDEIGQVRDALKSMQDKSGDATYSIAGAIRELVPDMVELARKMYTTKEIKQIIAEQLGVGFTTVETLFAREGICKILDARHGPKSSRKIDKSKIEKVRTEMGKLSSRPASCSAAAAIRELLPDITVLLQKERSIIKEIKQIITEQLGLKPGRVESVFSKEGLNKIQSSGSRRGRPRRIEKCKTEETHDELKKHSTPSA